MDDFDRAVLAGSKDGVFRSSKMFPAVSKSIHADPAYAGKGMDDYDRSLLSKHLMEQKKIAKALSSKFTFTRVDSQSDDDMRKVLVLKVTGFGIPAQDALHEHIPTLLVKNLLGETVGGVKEALHTTSKRQTRPHRTHGYIGRDFSRTGSGVDSTHFQHAAPPERAGISRSHRPTAINTGIRRTGVSHEKGATEQGRILRTRSPGPQGKGRGIHRTASSGSLDSMDLSNAASVHAHYGTLDVVWKEVRVSLDKCYAGVDGRGDDAERGGRSAKFVIECQRSTDDSVISTSACINLDRLTDSNLVGHRFEAIMSTPPDARDKDEEAEEEARHLPRESSLGSHRNASPRSASPRSGWQGHFGDDLLALDVTPPPEQRLWTRTAPPGSPLISHVSSSGLRQPPTPTLLEEKGCPYFQDGLDEMKGKKTSICQNDEMSPVAGATSPAGGSAGGNAGGNTAHLCSAEEEQVRLVEAMASGAHRLNKPARNPSLGMHSPPQNEKRGSESEHRQQLLDKTVIRTACIPAVCQEEDGGFGSKGCDGRGGREAGVLEMTGKVMTVCEANLRAAALALAKEKGLLHKHADEQDSEGNTPLLRAMMQDEILNALTLIKAGADVNRRNFKDESPFDIAQSKGLECFLAPLRRAHGGGWNPLMVLSEEGDASEVVSLVKKGVGDVDVCNEAGCNALSYAVANGHTGVIGALAEAGADLNKTSCQINGLSGSVPGTPLMKAAVLGNHSAVKLLLDKQASVDEQRPDGSTALMDAAAAGHAQVVRLLVSYSGSTEARRDDGATPLLLAVGSGSSSSVVMSLLEAGAQVNATQEFRECRLDVIRPRHARMFSGVSGREFGQHDESPRRTRRPLGTALEQQGHLYVATGSVGGVVAGGVGGSKQRVHEHAFVDPTTFKLPLGQGEEGVTALMLAAWKGHGLIAAHLLAHKADVNAQSVPNGYTALHGAVGNGHALLVSLLVRHNADVGMPDNEGSTALDEAANLNSKVYEELQAVLKKAAGLLDLTFGQRSKFYAQRAKLISEANQAERLRAKARQRAMRSNSQLTSRTNSTLNSPMASAPSSPRGFQTGRRGGTPSSNTYSGRLGNILEKQLMKMHL